MKKMVIQLNSTAFKYQAVLDHPVHIDLCHAKNTYAKAIATAKLDYWKDFLENVGEKQVWLVNGYTKNPVGDRGQVHIPSLKVIGADGLACKVSSNEDKAKALADSFFLSRPETSSVLQNFNYPNPLPPPPAITETQIAHHI
jgi:hypothetical protein